MVMVDVILLRLDKVEDTSFETSHSSYAIEAFCYNGVFDPEVEERYQFY